MVMSRETPHLELVWEFKVCTWLANKNLGSLVCLFLLIATFAYWATLYIPWGVGVILHKCKPYDFKCLLGKNITQELNKTIYIYKEHKIMFQVDMKNYGIYENT